jgi:hypothetical protein
MPYSVQQAVKNHPVTLWTYDCGPPCNLASAHLAKRGIPHTVRYSNKEPEVLKKLSGGTEVPVLVVGSTQLRGYLETTWDAALDSAGYPSSAPPGMKAAQGKVAESSKGAEPSKGPEPVKGKEPGAKAASDVAPAKSGPAAAAK